MEPAPAKGRGKKKGRSIATKKEFDREKGVAATLLLEMNPTQKNVLAEAKCIEEDGGKKGRLRLPGGEKL